MPGSQTVPVRNFPYGDVSITAKPRSWLRFIPFIGGAYIFRHGAEITFNVKTRCKGVSDAKQPAEALHSVRTQFVFAEGNIARPDMIRIPAPTSFNEQRTYQLPPVFLERTGDVTLRVVGSTDAFDTIYTFRVTDPTFTALTWAVAISSAVIAAVAAALLTAKLT